MELYRWIDHWPELPLNEPPSFLPDAQLATRNSPKGIHRLAFWLHHQLGIGKGDRIAWLGRGVVPLQVYKVDKSQLRQQLVKDRECEAV